MTTKAKTTGDDETQTGNADTAGPAAQTVQERAAVQADEYGQWIAAYDIQHEGALAFAAGHPIPASSVDGDGRVVTSMHRCHHTDNARCDRFNQADEWSEPGAAVRPAGYGKR